MAGAAAKRYARAVFELARDEDRLEDWRRHLDELQQVLSLPEVRAVLANPSIALQRRQEAVDALLAGRVGRESIHLAKLLVAGNRLDDLAGIVEEYGRLLDDEAGRVRASVTTAVPLGRADIDKLVQELSARLGREVRLETRVDRSIVAGLVLQIGDRVIDASVASRLQQLRRRLAGT